MFKKSLIMTLSSKTQPHQIMLPNYKTALDTANCDLYLNGHNCSNRLGGALNTTGGAGSLNPQ